MFFLGLIQHLDGIEIRYLDDLTGAVEVVGYSQDREATSKDENRFHESMILRPDHYSNLSGDSRHSKLKDERL
jgi:hypothetical protein